jgi:peptidyl-tRNA hydrolase
MKVLSKYEKNIKESKQVSEWLKQGNKKVIVPAKKMLKTAAADVRSRGSVAWGGKKARNVARFA